MAQNEVKIVFKGEGDLLNQIGPDRIQGLLNE